MSDEKERATAFADAMAEIEEKLYSGKMTINQARIKPGFKPLEGCGCLVISKSELIEPNESESEYFKKLINAKFEDNQIGRASCWERV